MTKVLLKNEILELWQYVYFSVNDKERNKSVNEEAEIIMDNSEQPVITIGDFNGNVVFKGR